MQTKTIKNETTYEAYVAYKAALKKGGEWTVKCVSSRVSESKESLPREEEIKVCTKAHYYWGLADFIKKYGRVPTKDEKKYLTNKSREHIVTEMYK